MKIGMQDDNCKVDISTKFGEFCTRNGRVIAQCIGLFLLARLFLGCALERDWREGRGRGGTVADLGVCKACVPTRVEKSFFFFRCGT